MLLRVVALVAAILALATVALVIDGLSDRLAPSDVAVVLGSKVNEDGTPSARLAARLDRAAGLYRQGLFRTVIVSGGVGREGFDEAVVMQAWLVAHGVPAKAILRDSQGVTTMATARNSAALMRAHGLRSALIVSQYFHISRIRLALARQGVRVTGTAHARIFELRDLYSIPREMAGMVVYLLRPSTPHAAHDSRPGE
jgi:vancomycin permeability regulator SanA